MAVVLLELLALVCVIVPPNGSGPVVAVSVDVSSASPVVFVVVVTVPDVAVCVLVLVLVLVLALVLVSVLVSESLVSPDVGPVVLTPGSCISAAQAPTATTPATLTPESNSKRKSLIP